jgi:hypothetical protein
MFTAAHVVSGRDLFFVHLLLLGHVSSFPATQ